MPTDSAKLDAIAKEIADCHMCRPHEMHVREILEKHLGEPRPEPSPCPLCGKTPRNRKDGDVCCTDMECPLDGTFTAAEWAKFTGNRLTLPLPVPPANTVRVRATCVVTRDGKWWTIHGMCGDSDSDSRAACFADGVDDEWVNVRIITADVTLQDVPEIVGRVEEANHAAS